jgi:hypothetical protein
MFRLALRIALYAIRCGPYDKSPTTLNSLPRTRAALATSRDHAGLLCERRLPGFPLVPIAPEIRTIVGPHVLFSFVARGAAELHVGDVMRRPEPIPFSRLAAPSTISSSPPFPIQ